MKKVLIAVIAVLVVLALAVCLIPGSYKMERMADYSFRQIRNFDYQKYTGNDPLKEELTKLFGEDKPESTQLLYDTLKQYASEMTWEVTETNTAECTASVLANVIDARPFINEYANLISNILSESLLKGELKLSGIGDVFALISDEENTAVISQAFSLVDSTARYEVPVTVNYEKKAGVLYVPVSFDEGVNDAVTSGIYSCTDEILPTVAGNMIKSLVTNLFDVIRSGDMEAIQKLLGSDLNLGTIKESHPETYDAILGFFSERAGEIEYDVISYDLENCSFEVDCSYSDAGGLVKSYMASILNYSVTHLFTNPIPTDADLAEMFTSSAAAQQLGTANRSCTITINPETGSVKVNEDMFNVLTANLFSKLTEITNILK